MICAVPSSIYIERVGVTAAVRKLCCTEEASLGSDISCCSRMRCIPTGYKLLLQTMLVYTCISSMVTSRYCLQPCINKGSFHSVIRSLVTVKNKRFEALDKTKIQWKRSVWLFYYMYFDKLFS